MTISAFIQKIYPDMNIRDAISLVSEHRLNINHFIRAECKFKRDDLVDVVEYYETKNN